MFEIRGGLGSKKVYARTYIHTLSFQFQVVTYDTEDPENRATADVTVLVTRNPSGPIFQEARFEVTISETFPLGDVVVNTTAQDSDGVSDRLLSY